VPCNSPHASASESFYELVLGAVFSRDPALKAFELRRSSEEFSQRVY
jgi:hypothetical protein